MTIINVGHSSSDRTVVHPEDLASVIAGTASDAVIKAVLNTAVAKRELDVLERLRAEGPFSIQRCAERRLKVPAIAKLIRNSGAAPPPSLPSFDSFTGNFNPSIFKRAVKSFYRQTRQLPCEALYSVYFIQGSFAVFPVALRRASRPLCSIS